MSGIVCAGHWVLDRIKFVDNWPKQAELCNIVDHDICNGGARFNVIIDLANLEVNFQSLPMQDEPEIAPTFQCKVGLKLLRDRSSYMDEYQYERHRIKHTCPD